MAREPVVTAIYTSDFPMEPFQKIIWSEGMFLTPHHFQQWDNYYEGLLNQRFEHLSPFNWGVADLTIDGDALTNGQVVITGTAEVVYSGEWLQPSA